MDFLIQNAWAEGGNGAPSGDLLQIGLLVLLFVVFYIILIRPQQKRMKEHKAMVSALGKGDEVITNGGLFGKVTQLHEDFLIIEIANNVEVKIQRPSVAVLLPKGTIREMGKNTNTLKVKQQP